MEEIKKCPSCGADNKYSSKFCTSCGSPLNPVCPNCKKEVRPTDKFCNNCGASLKVTATTETVKGREAEKIPPHIEQAKQAPPKRKLSRKARIVIIASGSVVGFMLIAFLALFLIANFYIPKKYTIGFTSEGNPTLISKDDIPELSFGKLTVCEDVDGNTWEPINPRDSFEIGFRQVYAAIKVTGALPGDGFSFKWKYADTEEEIIDFSYDYFTAQGYFDGYERSYLAVPEGEDIARFKVFNQPGSYIVEFYHNSEFIDSAGFDVTEQGMKAASMADQQESKKSVNADTIVLEGEIENGDELILNIDLKTGAVTGSCYTFFEATQEEKELGIGSFTYEGTINGKMDLNSGWINATCDGIVTRDDGITKQYSFTMDGIYSDPEASGMAYYPDGFNFNWSAIKS